MYFLEGHCSSIRCTCLLLISGLFTSLSGCGQSVPAPPLFHISGEVTYDDAPVPYGEISFEPDSAQGNSGPGTQATIENGVYSTKNGRGIVGGAMVVRISGFDGNSPDPGGTQPHGLPLFKQYSENIELPTEESTQNFNVPKK